MPHSTPKSQANAERSYSNQSRKEVPAGSDSIVKKPYAQKRVSVPEFATEHKNEGEPKESPQLHQKEKTEQ